MRKEQSRIMKLRELLRNREISIVGKKGKKPE